MKVYPEFSPSAFQTSINMELLEKVIHAKAQVKAKNKFQRIKARLKLLQN